MSICDIDVACILEEESCSSCLSKSDVVFKSDALRNRDLALADYVCYCLLLCYQIPYYCVVSDMRF